MGLRHYPLFNLLLLIIEVAVLESPWILLIGIVFSLRLVYPGVFIS